MINDFSTLIQLSATLAIAFVAIEAVSSYTKTLCESVYCLQDYINTKLDDFFKTVTDRMTLDQIKPVNIEGKSTNPKIEEAKRNRENIEKEVKTLKENKYSVCINSCQPKSFSTLCLFSFLFDIELLILGGLEATCDVINFPASILCILSFFYYLLGWFLGESKRKIINGFRYRSLIHSIFSSILIFLLSVTVVLILKAIDCIEIFKEIFNETVRLFIIVCGTLLPFINFVVFLFKIRSKVTDLKEELNEDIKDLETKRDMLNNDVNQLLSVNAVEASLRVD